AIGINGGGVILTVHGHSDGITSLDVFTHGTGDGHVGLGLGLVDHVIPSNGVDRDRSFGQISVYTVAAVGFSRSGVTRSVFRFHLGVYIDLLDLYSFPTRRSSDLAIGINGGGVILTVHGHSDSVASLDVFTHGTSDGHVRSEERRVGHESATRGVARD